MQTKPNKAINRMSLANYCWCGQVVPASNDKLSHFHSGDLTHPMDRELTLASVPNPKVSVTSVSSVVIKISGH
jgi:hypothetical protein